MLSNTGNSHSYALLELPAKVEYALLALMELASHRDPKNPLTINEIASRQPIPERYLEQIFTLLRRGGVVQSQRGAKGGYLLLREPWRLTVMEIITLVEGDRKSREPHEASSVERELVHEIWQQANTSFQAALSQCTLQDLCHLRDTRKQKHPMYYI